jgi:hypothetical protein
MTTPQNELFMLSNRIKHLTSLFEGGEDEDSIFETIKSIEFLVKEITESQNRQENIIALIVKLLSKDEKK